LNPVIRGYRPDLDGLRTVAVYLVLLFHSGLAWFGGGFIGVDLFFCLSGFLVGGVLINELQDTGSLRVGRFYSRRIRRLLPAAVVAIVATCLVFTLLWSVVRRAQIVGDAVSALLYYANFHFMAAASDYFAADVDKSPFLHFWSLSIEEQFYAFFPVLLILLFRVRGSRRRPVVLGVLGAILAVSLVAQIHTAASNVDRAYYGTGTRLYQLLAGALLVAVLAFTTRRLSPRVAHVVAVAGLAGVLFVGSGLWHVSASWRGIGATVAAVVLLAGITQAPGSPLSKALSVRPMAYLGRISYGTYLWHWPIIVALTTVLHTSPVNIAVLDFALATGLAALSYELVEIPIRRSPRLDVFTWPVVTTGLATSALVAVIVVPAVLDRPQPPALVAATSGASTATGQDLLAHELAQPVPQVDYVALSKQAGDSRFCTADDVSACHDVQNGGPTVLLVGDSQAQTFVPVFRKLAEEHHFSLDLNVLAGCPWQEGLSNAKQSADSSANCADARDGWYDDVLPQLHPDVVVLLARPRDDPAEWSSLLSRRDGTKEPLDQAVWQATQDTLTKVTAVAPAVVVQRMIMPETFSPTDCLAGAKHLDECVVTAEPKPSVTDAYTTTIAAENHRVHTVDFNPIFCPTAPVCSPVRDGHVVFRDDHHYTVEYAMAKRAEVWDTLNATGLFGKG
jgi:peptidoglycan/LPS O-acetylase OafA/YrhL